MGSDFSLVQFKARVEKLFGSIVDKRNSKNLKVTFKKCTFVLNEKASVYPYHKAMIEQAQEVFENEDFYFTRADLVNKIGALANPSSSHEKVMEQLRPYISVNDLGAILSASQVCNMEDKGVGEIKQREAHNKHIQAYKEKGRIIYNWLRSGEVFEKDILPVLSFYEKMDGGQLLFQTTIWDAFLKFHPFRFFVPGLILKEDLQDEILKRLFIYQQKEIKIYARGKKVDFTQKILEELKEELKNCEIKKSKLYVLGKTSARKFTISKK